MYAKRAPKDRVDVVDLDPYGTAAPFIDAAVGCIADGGETCPKLAAFRLNIRSAVHHLHRYGCLGWIAVSREMVGSRTSGLRFAHTQLLKLRWSQCQRRVFS